MNLHDVRRLQQFRGYPSITITLPTHRTSPDNRQDPIRLKNLVTEVTQRLRGEFAKREVDDLLASLDRLVRGIDFQHTLDGLALFVSRETAAAVQLPFRITQRTVIDETFATRDLVYGMNHASRYWVLALSEKPTRLFEGRHENLSEVVNGQFPMTHEGQGGEEPLPGGFGIKKSAIRDERHRQFFRGVDSALKAFTTDDPLPIIVVGVDRYLSFFREVSSHRNDIVGTVTGSYDKTPAHELAKLVWPLMKEHLRQQSRNALAELEKAIGDRKYVSTVKEVWRRAHEGRGEILLVEEDFLYPARLDNDGHLIPAEDPAAPGVIDDAVDEIIEAVLAKKGKAVFVEKDLLREHQRIALILRY